MKNRKLFILFIITVIFILVAVLTYRSSVPGISSKKEILLPELSARINEISRIEIAGNNNTVTLHKENNQWVIENADNYPVLFDKVRTALVNLSELRIVADKTDNPELYSRLGVQGHDKKASPSLRVTLFADQNNALTSLIIGYRKTGKTGSNLPGWYVRRPDIPGAILVEGHLDISAQNGDWFNRNILDIASSRIMEMTIEHPNKEKIRLAKSNKGQVDFDLLEPDLEDKSVLLIILTRLGKVLEELRMDGVRMDKNIKYPEDHVRTMVTTFDGLVINIKSAKINGKNYSRFSFTTKSPVIDGEGNQDSMESDIMSTDPVKEAELLNMLTSGWVYELPDFKYADITASLSDITSKTLPGMDTNDAGINSIQELDFPALAE